MSSSANRRPRVAGERRRPRPSRPDGTRPQDAPPEVAEESVETDHPGGEASASDDAVGADPDGEVDADGPTDDADADDADADADGADADGADADGAEADDDGARRGRGPRRALLIPAAALALVLALFAAVVVVTRQDPGEPAREANAAAATAKGTLEQILSYNYENMTQQVPANQALLTGSFKKEFGDTMTKTIVPLAQKEKTVVKARVYEVGVMSQTADTVTVQAFVNQASTREGDKEPAIDQNRVIATLTQVGNKWLVSQLKAY